MRNTAKNDITGVYIKSKAVSTEGRDQWDNIFSKRSGLEWLEKHGLYLNTTTGWDVDALSL